METEDDYIKRMQTISKDIHGMGLAPETVELLRKMYRDLANRLKEYSFARPRKFQA